MARESTSARVGSIAARALPMGYLQFVAFLAVPDNFRGVKSALASALSQVEPKGDGA